jgi:hypothetical protein
MYTYTLICLTDWHLVSHSYELSGSIKVIDFFLPTQKLYLQL